MKTKRNKAYENYSIQPIMDAIDAAVHNLDVPMLDQIIADVDGTSRDVWHAYYETRPKLETLRWLDAAHPIRP